MAKLDVSLRKEGSGCRAIKTFCLDNKIGKEDIKHYNISISLLYFFSFNLCQRVGLLLHNGVKRYLHELVLDSAGLLAIVLSSDLCRRFAGFSSCFGLGIGGGGAAAVGTDYSNVVPVSVLFASS